MKIESGIPAPKSGTRKYPFSDMNPGESVFFEGQEKRGRAMMAAYQTASRKGMKFVCDEREENGIPGVRIWRVE